MKVGDSSIKGSGHGLAVSLTRYRLDEVLKRFDLYSS